MNGVRFPFIIERLPHYRFNGGIGLPVTRFVVVHGGQRHVPLLCCKEVIRKWSLDIGLILILLCSLFGINSL